MASTSASGSLTTIAPPSPVILLFARGVVALLDLWPALTIAVREEWGGHESAEKKTWIASSIIDEWETRVTYLPSSTPSGPAEIDPKDASDTPLDRDDLGDFINQMMEDEFDAKIEDGSIDSIANDIVRLWQSLLTAMGDVTPESLVLSIEEKVKAAKKTGIKASRGDDPTEGDDLDGSDSGSEDDDEMEVDEAPQLVPREKEKVEPVVDDDGFTLVQKGRKGK